MSEVRSEGAGRGCGTAADLMAGIEVLEVRDVVVQRFKQAVPGQLGQLSRRMADAGINIEVLYSDHDHQLVLVVDKLEEARAVSARWSSET